MEHLVFSTPGTFLGKKSERLAVKRKDRDSGGETRHVPFMKIREITVTADGISFSSTLLRHCVEQGIPVFFMKRDGTPWGILNSPFLTASAATRRAQFAAFTDRRSVALSREILKAKIYNQGALLRYFGKYLKKKGAPSFGTLEAISERLDGSRQALDRVDGSDISRARENFQGVEGAASSMYWRGVSVITGGLFPGRVQRSPDDPVNASLNYGYGILYSRVSACLVNAGLDIYAGFLHTDRAGKPSLVFDFIEEFRQPAVDRAVIAIFNRSPGMINMKGGLLDDNSRKYVAARVLSSLERDCRYGGSTVSLNAVIQKQARRLAAFLRNEKPYRGATFKW